MLTIVPIFNRETAELNNNNMITFYDKKDMVSFGKYLLSKERKESFAAHHSQDDPISLAERLEDVYHSDFENWREMNEVLHEEIGLKP